MASINIYSHDRIDLTTGLMALITGLYGNNALQTINVTRNTPRTPQQAVGYLGVVDYTRGAITSDLTLDTVLVETSVLTTEVATAPATALSDLYRYAAQTVDFSTESYCMTSFAMACSTNSAATCNYGYLCGTLSSYLTVKAAPNPLNGTQYAFVLGDQGLGLDIVPVWTAGTTPTDNAAGLPIMNDNASGILTNADDDGIPAGVQSINMSGNINRDQVMDIRSTRPVGFITTYPLDITMDMEVYQMPQVYTTPPGPVPPTNPSASMWKNLTDISIVQRNNHANVYAHIIGLNKQSEGESVSVGRYLAYTVRFQGSDIFMPIAAMPSPGSSS